MGLIVHCSYCNWVGHQPSPGEYETAEEYDEALKDYEASHDDPERNACPGKEA